MSLSERYSLGNITPHHGRRWGLTPKPDEYRNKDPTTRTTMCGILGRKVRGARGLASRDPHRAPG